MYTLKIENKSGEVLTLTQNEKEYQVISVTGLNPVPAILQTSTIAGMDGVKFNSAKLNPRNIVITLRLNDDVERNRLQLYHYFKSKQYCKIYFHTECRNVFAEGYVENIECDLFTISEQMQISIVCPDPYFYSVAESVKTVSDVNPLFEFAFAFGAEGVTNPTITDPAIEFSTYNKSQTIAIVNSGEEETGVIAEIRFTGDVSNPYIYDIRTEEVMRVNTDFEFGDVLTINTNQGNKSVTITRNGESPSNGIRYLDKVSEWLQLSTGDNCFGYGAESGADDMELTFRFRTKYEAV
ncbi:MAG: phage tail family protein [Bacteroidaceae bacterium]|nr:phage tail family protein [Bacteroidaceae bacterium]